MSICNGCGIIMNEKDYAAEGLCQHCYYDKVLEDEAKLDEITLEEELEDMVDEIMLALYTPEEDDHV